MHGEFLKGGKEERGPEERKTPGSNYGITTSIGPSRFTYQIRQDVTPSLEYGDSITYELVNSPSEMIINSTTGLIIWDYTNASIGDHTITVKINRFSRLDMESGVLSILLTPPDRINN